MLLFTHLNILAADDQWTENIIFLVIAGFWIVGAIVKGLSKKAKKGDDKLKSQPASPLKQKQAARPPGQTIGQTLSQKLSEIVDSLEQQAQPKPKAPQKPVPQPYRPPAVKHKPPVSAEKPSAINQDIQQPYPKPSVAKKKQVQKISRIPVLFDSSDELKKAILYYEILGKPVSLREKPF